MLVVHEQQHPASLPPREQRGVDGPGHTTGDEVVPIKRLRIALAPTTHSPSPVARRPSRAPVARARARGSVDGPLWAVDSFRHRDGSLALRAPVQAIKVRHGYYVMSDCCKARAITSGYGFDQILPSPFMVAIVGLPMETHA